MKFFFDNCISLKFVQALRILVQVQGYELVHFSEQFAADAPGEDGSTHALDFKEDLFATKDGFHRYQVVWK